MHVDQPITRSVKTYTNTHTTYLPNALEDQIFFVKRLSESRMLRTLAAGASVCSIYMFKAGSYQVSFFLNDFIPTHTHTENPIETFAMSSYKLLEKGILY